MDGLTEGTERAFLNFFSETFCESCGCFLGRDGEGFDCNVLFLNFGIACSVTKKEVIRNKNKFR